MSVLDSIARELLRGKIGGSHPGGIRAYHSSPHDFDKFDWSKLRTGEGANTYGAGFYFAENPMVSGQGGQYWRQFLNRSPPDERLAAEFLHSKNFDRSAAIAANEENIARLRKFYADDPGQAANAIARLQKQSEEIASGKLFGPRTYEVNINARPELFLDWDKPLRDQPNAVQQLAGEPHALSPKTGEQLYHALTRDVRIDDPRAASLRTSEMLREAGVPGIRYLDQGSRGARDAIQPQTYNYVTFDPDKIDIMAKYGLVGAGGAGLAAAAAPGQAQAAQPTQSAPPQGFGSAVAPNPRDAFEAAALRTARPYARANAARQGENPLPEIAEGLAPKEPWEWGLMFAGPGAGWVGRGISALPRAARTGAAALGFGLTSGEANPENR